MIGRLVARQALSQQQEQAMWSLFEKHFTDVAPQRFQEDLATKNWILLIENGDTGVVGFSTLLFEVIQLDGDPVSLVYSGDTIMDPSAWGSPILSRAWIHSVLHLNETYGKGRLWWLLLTSGFRTYRFLPLYYKEFFPCFDRQTPVKIARNMNLLAARQYSNEFDPNSGIVRFKQPQCLDAHLVQVPESRLKDPHVSFFLEKNPNHARGDELVCITEISRDNLTRAGLRMVRSPKVQSTDAGILIN